MMNMMETIAERTYVHVSKGSPKKTYETEGETDTATLTLSGMFSEIFILPSRWVCNSKLKPILVHESNWHSPTKMC